MSACRRLVVSLGILLAAACGDSGPAHPYIAEGAPDQVVLVTVGALRADHMRSYGYEPRKDEPGVLGRDLSSYFIDQILGNNTPTPGDPPVQGDPQAGVVFANAQASSSATGPSLASLHTGLIPSKHGVVRNGLVLDDSLTTLAELFKEAGYETGAFLAVRHLAGLRQGFDTVKARHTYAQMIARDAEEWLGKMKKRGKTKLFMWVHFNDVRDWWTSYPTAWPSYEGSTEYMSRLFKGNKRELYRYLSHLHGLEPEVSGEPFPTLAGGKRLDSGGSWTVFRAEDRDRILDWANRYDGRLYTVDLTVRELFKRLQDLELPGRKLYVLTSPHGEALGDHGYVGHDRELYEAQLRVPLLMRFSGADRPRGHVPQLVRLTDLYPTLAQMLGRDPNLLHTRLDGEPLWPLMPGARDPAGQEPRVAYAERRAYDEMSAELNWVEGEVWSVRTPDHRLIVRDQGEDELYLMRDKHLERVNLAGREPPHPAEAPLRRLLEEQRAWLREHADEIPAAGETPEGWLFELVELGDRMPPN